MKNKNDLRSESEDRFCFLKRGFLGGYGVGWCQGAVFDLGREVLCLLLRIGWHILTHRSIANAIDFQIEGGRSIAVLPVLEALDRIIYSRVYALDGAGNHAAMDGVLVAVYTDAIDAFLIGSIERTDAAATGDLEDDVGLVLVDLAGCNVFALGRIVKGLRIVHKHFYARIDLLSAVLVPGDVVVDRWNGEAAHRRNSVLPKQLRHLALAIYFHLPGNGSNQAASLLLFEGEGCHIGQCLAVATVQRRRAAVDDGEIFAGILLGYLVYRAIHEEADGDNEVRALRSLCQVGYVIAGRLRLNQLLRIAELFSRLCVALVGQLVEALVIDAARVGDDSDSLCRFGCASTAASVSAACSTATTASSEQHSKYGDE